MRVEVRGADVLLTFKAGPKVLGQVWEGCLGVLAGYKMDPYFSAFAITPTPPPPHPPAPPTTPTHQIAPQPANPCPQLIGGVDQ